MYDRFTDRSKEVLQRANTEAQRLNNESICSEHLLLGLIKLKSGVAPNVLKYLDLDLLKICNEVERIVGPCQDPAQMRQLSQAPQTKKILEYAMDEACKLNHDYVGTEHLLLGIMRDGEGLAAQILINLGLNLDVVRLQVRKIFGLDVENAN